MKTSHFVDTARIHVQAGKGGDGVVAFRREKFVPEGGPAGGHGGDGGSIYLEGDANLATLLDFRARPLIRAQAGANGANFNRAGHNGEDVILKVPLGVCAYDEDTQEEIGEITRPGQRLLLARGGRGGRGNESFATPTNRTPREAELGEPGQERNVILELKMIADIGLIGLPNAGKSTLLAALTRAHPKIAAYPFTTLSPNLGVMHDDALARSVTLADIPGLIEGASRGAGLGDRFLRHIERTKLLAHLVAPPDGASDPGGDARALERLVEDCLYSYHLVRAELAHYSEALPRKPALLCLNKCDLLSEATLAALRAAFEREGLEPLVISAERGDGLDTLRARLLATLAELAAAEEEKAPPGASEIPDAAASGGPTSPPSSPDSPP